MPEKTSLLDEILHYIETHLSDTISLSSIAEHFLVSQSAISHMFKKQMDVSFYQVVIQRRLIESKNLILAGVPLKAIPEQCGFSDYSVFYKAFVKEYGISPSNIRITNLQLFDLHFFHCARSRLLLPTCNVMYSFAQF